MSATIDGSIDDPSSSMFLMRGVTQGDYVSIVGAVGGVINGMDSGMVGGRMYLPSIFDLGKTGEPQFSLGY